MSIPTKRKRGRPPLDPKFPTTVIRVRITKADQAYLKGLIRRGLASNVSAAVRLCIRNVRILY